MQMERIAAELGIDPIELRRINMLHTGDRTATGQRLTWSVGSEDVLNAAVERSDFFEKKQLILIENARGSDQDKRRGIGISFFFHGAGFTGSREPRMTAQA